MTPAELLKSLPQTKPCRFVDEFVEAGPETRVSRYTWTEQDCDGHFPGNPVVPGVKMLAMAAQTAFPAEGGAFAAIERMLFKMSVRPDETVACRAALRDGGRAADVQIEFAGGPKDGEVILSGRIIGGKG